MSYVYVQRLAVRIGDAGEPVPRVVGERGDARGVGRRDHVAVGVVGVGHRRAVGQRDAGDLARGVVGIARDLAVRVGERERIAQRVVGRGCDGVVRVLESTSGCRSRRSCSWWYSPGESVALVSKLSEPLYV